MNPSYKRDMNHNYLILEPDERIFGNEYQIRMMSLNPIKGLLRCNMKRIDGNVYFYYEVTSKQSLERSFEKTTMSMDDICKLLLGIKKSLENVSGYLLESDQVLLDPEYIYLEPETKDTFLCYFPSYKGTIAESFCKLSEYILKKLDHNDARAVSMGYDIYRQTIQENYSVIQVIKSIYQIQNHYEEKSNEAVISETKGSIISKTNESVISGTKESIISETNGTVISKINGSVSTQNNKEIKTHFNGSMNKDIGTTIADSRNDKDNKKEKKKEQKRERIQSTDREAKSERRIIIFTIAVALVCLSAVAISAVVFKLNTTQLGGIIFLILGSLGYVLSTVHKRSSKDREQPYERKRVQSEWIDDLDEGISMDKVSIELEEQVKSNKSPEVRGFKERNKHTGLKSNLEELFGETTLLYEEGDSPLCLISMEPGVRGNIILKKDMLLVGKMKSKVDVVIDLPVISRIHAKLWKDGTSYYVEDLNSKNGTFINGQRLGINEKMELHSSDELAFATACYYIGSL